MTRTVNELKKVEDDLNLSANREQLRQFCTTFLKVSEYVVMTFFLTANGVLLTTIYIIWATPGAGQDEMDNNIFERIQQTMRIIFIISAHP